MQLIGQSTQETKDANTQAITGLEEWIGQSGSEYPTEHQLDPINQYWDNESIEDNNEEEELQSQLMAKGHYMIDEDDSRNSYREHVQATTTLEWRNYYKICISN
jgi:hypothetical protein